MNSFTVKAVLLLWMPALTLSKPGFVWAPKTRGGGGGGGHIVPP